jgi:hypothetical protein
MSSRKDMLLEKAKNRIITQQESIELRNVLEQEARNAQAVGDFVKFLVILGVLVFLGALIAELFGDSR